jgi:DNA-binding NtrC family response regulator
MTKRVLVVDDDPTQRRILEATIKRFGYAVVTADSGEQALATLKADGAGDICLTLLDLVMPGTDGMAVLTAMRSRPKKPPAIVQTAHGSIDAAIAAMRAGAVDFVVKPVSPERLEVSIKNALKIEALEGELTRMKAAAKGELGFRDLIAGSEAMTRVIALGKRAATSTIPVLIEGESGVGKELVARAIQGESDRKAKPFVTVNCGAIPENLVESILFGHEKGSFTGASEKRAGRFAEADGGTLFLDEIGDMPVAMQAKLLRVLEEGEVERVGGDKPIRVNVRVLVATHRNLEDLVKQNTFRRDLFHRIYVFPLLLPPLRERLEDFPVLIEHFVRQVAAQNGWKEKIFAKDAIDELRRYSWPGNIRELRNVIERLVLLAGEDPVAAADVRLVLPTSDGASSASGPSSSGTGTLAERTEQFEREVLLAEIHRQNFHMTNVARAMGLERSHLYKKCQQLGIDLQSIRKPE